MWTALHTVYCTSPSIPLSVCSLKGNSTIAKQCIVWAVIDATIENTNKHCFCVEPTQNKVALLPTFYYKSSQLLPCLSLLKEVGIETDWLLFCHLLDVWIEWWQKQANLAATKNTNMFNAYCVHLVKKVNVIFPNHSAIVHLSFRL